MSIVPQMYRTSKEITLVRSYVFIYEIVKIAFCPITLYLFVLTSNHGEQDIIYVTASANKMITLFL